MLLNDKIFLIISTFSSFYLNLAQNKFALKKIILYTAFLFLLTTKITAQENKEIQIEFDEEFDFRAGSYNGYNKFRNELCISANNIQDKKLWTSKNEAFKFYWLINFTDCDGYIGTSYCKILYDEFVKYENEVKSNLNEYFHKTYDNFKEAFRLASNNGLVSFH